MERAIVISSFIKYLLHHLSSWHCCSIKQVTCWYFNWMFRISNSCSFPG